MHTSAADEAVIELADEYAPAEILTSWVERTPDIG